MSDTGLLLAGDILIDRLTSGGVPTGYSDPVNVTQLEITHPDPDRKDRVSRKKDSLGQALDTVLLPKPVEIQITIDSQPAEVLAMALNATSEAINDAGGSVTDEAKTLKLNKWIKLNKRNIAQANFVLATVAAPSTPLVEGTDYEVNRVQGLVKALNAGTAVACLIDYDYGALSGTKYNAGAETVIKCRILLDGVNKVNGNVCRLEIDQATLSPAAPIDWMSGEFISAVLKGTLNVVTGEDEPYRYEETAA